MTRFLISTVFLTVTSCNLAFAQRANIQAQTIKDIKQIDSLFRQVDGFYWAHIDIDYNKNKLKFFYYPTADSLETTTTLDSLTIRQYCNKTKTTKTKFEIIYPLLTLMIKNKFISISPAGPGDCAHCSVIIFVNDRQSFVIKDLKDRCMPDDCYDGENKEKRKKLADNIWLVKRKI